MLWIIAAAALVIAVYLLSRAGTRGRPMFVGFGLLYLAATVLLGTLALMSATS